MELQPRYYSARELAEAAGCTRKALRVYQAKRLISPARSTGNRRYSVDGFRRLRFIVALRAVGVSVDEIRALLAAREQPQDSAGAVARELAGRVSELIPRIAEKIRDLLEIRNELVESRETLHACSCCTRSSTANCGECADAYTLDPTSSLLLAGRQAR